jgi:hypothetical protein
MGALSKGRCCCVSEGRWCAGTRGRRNWKSIPARLHQLRHRNALVSIGRDLTRASHRRDGSVKQPSTLERYPASAKREQNGYRHERSEDKGAEERQGDFSLSRQCGRHPRKRNAQRWTEREAQPKNHRIYGIRAVNALHLRTRMHSEHGRHRRAPQHVAPTFFCRIVLEHHAATKPTCLHRLAKHGSRQNSLRERTAPA